jgi:hypothetical protein
MLSNSIQRGQISSEIPRSDLNFGKTQLKTLYPFIGKITTQMNSWTSKHLSFAGRLQPVQSIPHCIEGFWASIFVLPKKVVMIFEQNCSRFFYGNGKTFLP